MTTSDHAFEIHSIRPGTSLTYAIGTPNVSRLPCAGGAGGD